MALLDRFSKTKTQEEQEQMADMTGISVDLKDREGAISKVGEALKGLSDDFVAVALKVDEEQKYYTSVVKDTPEGRLEYVVVEDTLLEAIDKERSAIQKLEEVQNIPECDERFLTLMISKTGKEAEEIVGDYLDKLSEYLLNEQERGALNKGNVLKEGK